MSSDIKNILYVRRGSHVLGVNHPDTKEFIPLEDLASEQVIHYVFAVRKALRTLDQDEVPDDEDDFLSRTYLHLQYHVFLNECMNRLAKEVRTNFIKQVAIDNENADDDGPFPCCGKSQ